MNSQSLQSIHVIISEIIYFPSLVTTIFGIPKLLSERSESLSVMSDSLQPCGLYSPWNSPGQNTGVSSLSLLQGIFPTQGLNPGLPHCRWILYQLSHKINTLKIGCGCLILSSAIYQDDHFVFHCSVHTYIY